MADKKLSSVSTVTDVNYVYAETSTGETVKISKASLASVRPPPEILTVHCLD